MDNELICNKLINQYLLRGRKFVEYACFRYGYYNAQISGKIGNGFVDDFQYFVFTKSIKSLGSIRELLRLGHVEDVFIILRTSFEGYIASRYIDEEYNTDILNAKVVLNVMAWLSGLMIAVTGYRHINWKELLKMSAVMLVGMFAGIQICRIVKSENILLTIYGIIIVVVALKNLCIHTEKKLPDLILWIVLILAGIIHGMFVSGGALLVIYATQVLKEKEEFRATVAPVWVVLNFFLMVTQFRSGLVGTADIRLICISILPLLIATWLGKKLVCKVSQKVFLNLTYILLLISGVSLIV